MQTERGFEHTVTRATAGLLAVILLLGMCSAEGAGQPSGAASHGAPRLPFVAGERLEYEVRVGNIAAGRGTMSIEGPVDLRGVPTLLLRSDMRAGVGLLNGSGRTRSWLDSRRMTSLRFSKNERQLLTRHSESFEVYPEERRWTASDGRTGKSVSDVPLDELSFIYFVRTLDLEPGATFSFTRHFEKGRNPVLVKVVGREKVTVPAGEFAAVVVEMRVKDPQHYKGVGVIRLHLTDDECRLPVRIESVVPGVGRTVLELKVVAHPQAHCAPHA